MDPQISSDAPEAVNFDSMTEQELDAQLDQAEAGNESAPAQQANQEAGPSAIAPTATAQAPNPLEEKIAALEKQLTAISKESGQARALQSKIAQLENRLKANDTPPTSPEQLDAQKQLNDYIHKAIQEKYGPMIQGFEVQQENAAYKATVSELCEEMGIPFEDVNPIMAKILDADMKAYQAGDQQAWARIERALDPKAGPGYLLMRGMSERSKQVQTQAASFQTTKQNAAVNASKTVRTSNPVQSVQKNLDEMSPKELEGLSEEQLDKLIESSGGTGY
jgi:hypothetical protein